MSEKTVTPKNKFRDFIEGLLVALIAALIIRQFVVQAYTIPTASMEKSLLIGDFLLVNKFNCLIRDPTGLVKLRRNHVIVNLGRKLKCAFSGA